MERKPQRPPRLPVSDGRTIREIVYEIAQDPSLTPAQFTDRVKSVLRENDLGRISAAKRIKR